MPRASLVRASLGRAELRRAALQQFTSENTLSVVNRGLLTSSATLTNADERTYFDSSGLLQTASANEARTTYIDGVPYLWLDGAVTEISGRSFDLTNWPSGAATVAKDAVGLDGESNSGFTVTDDDAGSVEGKNLDTSITSSTDKYYMVCAIEKSNTSVYPRVIMLPIGGTPVTQGVVLDKDDGSYVVSNNQGAVTLDPILLGNYWIFVLEINDNGSGNTLFRMQIEPARNTTGTTTADASTTGDTVVGYCGLFKDNFSLMPILTTGGTTKTVATDAASLANSVISSLTEGTLYMEIWTPQLTSNAARHIAELESDSNNFIRVLHAADGDLDAQITDGGVSQAALAGTDLTVGQLQKVALSFGPGGFRLVRDGTLLDSGTGTVPSVDNLLIGAGLYGGIHEMLVEPTEWSQAKAEALTT